MLASLREPTPAWPVLLTPGRLGVATTGRWGPRPCVRLCTAPVDAGVDGADEIGGYVFQDHPDGDHPDGDHPVGDDKPEASVS